MSKHVSCGQCNCDRPQGAYIHNLHVVRFIAQKKPDSIQQIEKPAKSLLSVLTLTVENGGAGFLVYQGL